jgi:hypothetical protein
MKTYYLKTTKTFYRVFVCLFFILTACKKEEKNTITKTTQYSYEITYDGETISYTCNSALEASQANKVCAYTSQNGINTLQLGENAINNTKVVTVYFMTIPFALGQHKFSGTSSTDMVSVVWGNSQTSRTTGFSNSYVNINITEIQQGLNGHIRGTLSGIMYDLNGLNPKTISGKFDLSRITP